MKNLEIVILTSPSNDNAEKKSCPLCPICQKPLDAEYAPFCSKRCADVDLHRWLSGSYAIPAVEEDGDIDSEQEDGS